MPPKQSAPLGVPTSRKHGPNRLLPQRATVPFSTLLGSGQIAARKRAESAVRAGAEQIAGYVEIEKVDWDAKEFEFRVSPDTLSEVIAGLRAFSHDDLSQLAFDLIRTGQIVGDFNPDNLSKQTVSDIANKLLDFRVSEAHIVEYEMNEVESESAPPYLIVGSRERLVLGSSRGQEDEVTRALGAVASLSAQIEGLEQELDNAVDGARQVGATWQKIGLAVGVSQQAANKRWGKRPSISSE